MSSELAELFELMHGAPDSFRTLRAMIRDSIDYEPVRRLHARQLEEADAEGWAAYLAEGGGPDCDLCWSDSDHTTTLWIQQPDLLREESLTRTWEPLRVETNVGHTRSLYSNLLDPLALVPFVRVATVGLRPVAQWIEQRFSRPLVPAFQPACHRRRPCLVASGRGLLPRLLPHRINPLQH